MADNQHSELETDAQHYESILIVGMVWIKKPHRILVEEHCLRLFERDAVLTAVLAVLSLVPFETNVSHIYIVCIDPGQSSGKGGYYSRSNSQP